MIEWARTLTWPRCAPHVYRCRMDLVADIGGTHARFALADPVSGALHAARSVAAAEYPDIATAIRDYLDSVQGPASRGALAVAAPVAGPRIEFTNSPWSFERDSLRRALGFARLEILNDFEALALAVPSLPSASLRVLKPGVPDALAPCVVLGPGTGLGVAGLLRSAAGGASAAPRALPSQGGHIGFAPVDDLEIELLRFVQASIGRVSAEQLLSGRGLAQLYRFFSQRAARAAAGLTPAEVSARALAGDDPAAVEAVLRFWAMLGSFAADVALLYGAWGGVYIGGGIAPRLLALFDRSDFRARFAAHQPMDTVLAPVPIWLIEDPHAALLGAAAALR